MNDLLRSGLLAEGGCGKSTLAFEIARRCERQIVPLLVDEDWTGELIDYLRSMLSHNSRTPTRSMVEKLAHWGELVLVLDGLSERSSDSAQSQVRDIILKRLFRHLIVTSRDNKPGGASFESLRVVSVGALSREQLEKFVHAYVRDCDSKTVLSKLAPLLRDDHSINPLFARMAIEQVDRGRDLPGTYTELVVRYVSALCPHNLGSPTDDDFLRAGSLAAFSCVKDSLTPQEIEFDFLRGTLDKESEHLPFMARTRDNTISAARILDQLLRCYLLQRNTINRRIRFTHDPIAEYLAALYIVKNLKSPGVNQVCVRVKNNSHAGRGLAEALEAAERV